MRVKDLTGKRFGRLFVIRRSPTPDWRNEVCWITKCDCGNVTTIGARNLSGGGTNSCGCLRREVSRALGRSGTGNAAKQPKHGHTSAKHPSRTYSSWRSMLARCHDREEKTYSRYGARGLSVCKAWRDNFAAFLNDMGERPTGTTIDRRDNRFGYFASNCRWATSTEQSLNRRICFGPKGWRRFPKLIELYNSRPQAGISAE